MPNDDADASAACRHVGTSVDRWIVLLTRFLAGRVITYQAGGKQRIAVAAGLLNNIFQTKGEPVVFVYGL